MKNIIINEIEQKMVRVLNNAQMEQLHNVLTYCLFNVTIESKNNNEYIEEDNYKLLDLFLSSKKVEGCSNKTLKYYKSTIENMFNNINIPVKHIITDDLRKYLSYFQNNSKVSKITVDNVRRIILVLV